MDKFTIDDSFLELHKISNMKLPNLDDSYLESQKITNMKLPNLKDIINTDSLQEVNNAIRGGELAAQFAAESFKEMYKNKVRKEDEEKRRHNELIKALENYTCVTIGDGAKNVQIMQNSNNSSQSIVNGQEFDYEKVLNVLTEIKGYAESIKFKETFKERTDEVSSLIDETIKEVEEKGDEKLIQKSLKVLKDISIGVSSNLISSGIIALIGGLNI